MRKVWAIALCAAACGGMEEGANESDEAIESVAPHVLPLGREATAGTSARLTYWGGPVVEHAKVVAVLWGSAVDAQVAEKVGSFYKSFVGSSSFTWLSEYDTNTQHIGAGALAGVYTIAPSRKGKTLTDSQIQKELAAQIRKGALPKTDANTIYMLHFPPGVRITMGAAASCESGGFCGFHGSFKSRTAHARYAVIPDMGPGSGCDKGCGGGSPLSSVTSVASHELVEAVTDPDVGLAKGLAAPLAWYDASHGEIADICAGHQGTLRAGGTTWTIQKQWSNSARACVVSHP